MKIIDECKKANLPETIIEEITGGICVTVSKNRMDDNYLKQFSLNEKQLRAIAFLKEKGKITNKDFQELTNVSRETASGDLSELQKRV